MELYLDTAQLEEVRAIAAWGVLRGITTNPSHVARAGVQDMRTHIQEMCWIADVPTSVEVVTTDADEMVEQAVEYASWSPNVVIKLPTIEAGLVAMSRITKQATTTTCKQCVHLAGCPIRERFAQHGALTRVPEVNATLIFSANQALLALSAGASYVSPFVGRLDAVGEDGMQVVRDIAEILRVQQWPGKIIAAAMRHPLHVVEAAKAGAHIATMAHTIMTQMLRHPLTEQGLAEFMVDYERSRRS